MFPLVDTGSRQIRMHIEFKAGDPPTKLPASNFVRRCSVRRVLQLCQRTWRGLTAPKHELPRLSASTFYLNEKYAA